MAGSSTILAEPSSIFVTAPDGLKLHVRRYGPRVAPCLPVVCLPGLTRTAADFHQLAVALASDPKSPRQVFSLDYRGRGLSSYDRDAANYNLATELADLQTVLAALNVQRAVFIGTSRGGILTMLLASLRSAAIAGAVLNDIGPVIEPQGLARIKSYVGKMRQPADFADAAELLRGLFAGQFPRLSERDWLAAAHDGFKLEDGRLVPTYDPRIARTLDNVDVQQPQPPLWAQFDALTPVPLMVLRGANSDLLSKQTLEAMQARHPAMTTIVVPDQGHPPILADAELIGHIASFIASCQPLSAKQAGTPVVRVHPP
jgi:pimeloyl-ACP methyl ester carboxylesterase